MREIVARMRWFAWLSCLLLVGSQVLAEGTEGKPLAPVIATASGEATDAMQAIKIPEGWEIGLFAAEPDVANVVAFDIDSKGRIYVCESFRQSKGVTDNRAHDEQWLLADLSARTVQDRINYHKRLLGEAAITYAQQDDRIRRISDTDGDNVADESIVVANGFHGLEEGTGASVLARGDDLYYTCIPKLWKLSDKDGDGVADERKVMSDGYGVRVAFRGHDLHGLVLGPDGRLYFSIGDRGYHITTSDGRLLNDPASGAVFRCELDGSKLEVFATGLRNPQELAFNDVGDLFSVDNNSDSGDQARIVHILEGGDSGWRMYYQYLTDRGPFNRERLWEPLHNEQPAYIVPPIKNFTDGPSGLTYYPGTGFGDQLKDRFLICDFRGGPANSGVRSFQLVADGAFYKVADDDQPIWTCLATDIAFGPDGALYVSDWVDGWEGLGKGRVFRLTDPKYQDDPLVKEVQSLLASDWSSRSTEDLARDLQHNDRRIRLEAQWQLAQRGEHPTLLDTVHSSKATKVSRLHAIWGLEQIVRDAETRPAEILTSIRPLLNDKDEHVRAAVTSVLGQHNDVDSADAIAKLLSDSSARVQYHAIMALGNLKVAGALSNVVGRLAENKNTDPAIRHAGITYLVSAAKASAIAKLSEHKNSDVRRAAVVALRRKGAGEIADFLQDDNPLVVAEAARAIHDVPIPVALGKLAELIDQDFSAKEIIPPKASGDDEATPSDTPLARRVLNANYRIGSAEAAEKLARYTTQISAPIPMRLEALDMLAHWSKPDPRDRVLNDYRELKPRDGEAAKKALSSKIDVLLNTESKIREKMIDVASRLGIKKIAPVLVKRIGDTKLRAEDRANALESLSRLDIDEAAKLAKSLDFSSSSPIVGTALTVLAKHDGSKNVGTIVQATKNRDPRIQQQAWDLLANIDVDESSKAIDQAVDSYLKGELEKEVQLNVLEASKDRLSKEKQGALDKYRESLAQSDPLATWLPSLEGGHAGRGAEIFYGKSELSCVRCHKIDRTGGEVGPNLTVIGKQRDRRYLLEAICLPNAQIAKGFETAVVIDGDGTTHSGIVRTENDEYVELVKNDGGLVRIPQDDIEARRRGKSSMPADLIKQISPRELRDLVAFLSNLKEDPRGAGDVE